MESCLHVRGLESVKNEALFTPRMWACGVCGTTESVWACLQCSNIACGRFNEEHAVKHFNEKGHPLALEVNKKYLYCYECDNYVFNDNSYDQIALVRETLKEIETQVFNESLTRSGCVIRGASTTTLDDKKRIEKEKSAQEDKQYTAVCHWRLSLLSKVFNAFRKNVTFSKEEKKTSGVSSEVEVETKVKPPPRKRRKVIIPGVTGLRNLGNTCYMNSVLQVLSHLQFFRQCFLRLNKAKVPDLSPCLTSTPKNPRSVSAIYQRQTTVECYEHITMPLRKEKTWPKTKRKNLDVNLKEQDKMQQKLDFNEAQNVDDKAKTLKASTGPKLLLEHNSADVVEGREPLKPQTTTTQDETHQQLEDPTQDPTQDEGQKLQVSTPVERIAQCLHEPAKEERSQREAENDDQILGGSFSLHESNTGLLDKTLPIDYSFDNSKGNTVVGSSMKTKDCETEQQQKQVLFSDELHALFRVMWSGKWAIVTPLAVLHAVWHLIPSFLGYSQHDAQEFLCEVLQRLQRELEEHWSMNFNVFPEVYTQPKDILPNVFEGKLVSEVMCHNCRSVSTTCEKFWDLSLEFPDRYQVKPRSARGRVPPRRPSMESCHLTELLSKFTQSEMLEGRSYRCDKCCATSSPDALQFAQKQLQIAELPEVLRLHLKRFRWYCQSRGKIISHVGFDMKLDMKPYCHGSYFASYSQEDFLYDLSGVIIHLGTGFDAGHYVSYCWNDQADSWVYYNDARVSLCNEHDVLRSQAYILLYTRSQAAKDQDSSINNNQTEFTVPKTPDIMLTRT